MINGFRANPKDAEGHILFFDVEALITQMLTEEYSQMSPGTMEVQGFTNQVSSPFPAVLYLEVVANLFLLGKPLERCITDGRISIKDSQIVQKNAKIYTLIDVKISLFFLIPNFH